MREPFLKSRVLKIFISHLVKSILFLALQPFSCFSNQHPPQIEEGFRWRHNLPLQVGNPPNVHPVVVNPLLIDVPGALQPSQAAPGNLVGEIIGFYTTVSDFPSLQQWNTLLPIAD